MSKEFLTDEQVEFEIARLKESEYVKLAKREQRIKNARRQQMYQLRCLEKRGKELSEKGITYDSIEQNLFKTDDYFDQTEGV